MLNAIALTDRNLILTGYTGANLPRTGQLIAERLGMPFLNLDVLIGERIGASGGDIRESFGERRLKTVEADIVEETRLRRQTVIRVSARTLMHSDNLSRLALTGPVVCLMTSLDATLRRLHISMGGRYADPDERARELGELRQEWGIRDLPGMVQIDTTTMTADHILQTVVALYRERAILRD
jgi:shikimate kinase